MATDECRVSDRQGCESAVTAPPPKRPPKTGPIRQPAPWKSGHILATTANRVATILAPVAMPDIHTDGGDESPTTELVSATVGDRCSNCQQPLASDQRYCVNCGSRRGKARFSFDIAGGAVRGRQGAGAPQAASLAGLGRATLVAGIATLLLALGVGVLIGHNSNSTTQRAAAAPQILTVGGAGAGTGAGVSNSSAGNATANLKKHGKVQKTKQVVVRLNAATKAKASAAANKVFGSSSNNLVNNPTQQVGGACSGGAGCNQGKFDGNFFGNTP